MTDESKEIVDFLSMAESYSDRTSNVERLETHISWVLLTDTYAYKLKKRVKFDFLDFSSKEGRRQACDEEIRINRRLAPEVYLDVIPLNRLANGDLQLGGEGTIVDWLVRMKRLPADRALDQLILRGELLPAEITDLTQTLTVFYLQLPKLSVDPEKYRQGILSHVFANRTELLQPEHGLEDLVVKRVHCAQLKLLQTHPEYFHRRAGEHRIVDGHGDLRPEHIYFAPDPVVIDGVEFSAELRQLDVLDELSFLAMECTLLGAESLGTALLETYCQVADDDPPLSLLLFYQIYRACVRAKVAVLRAKQGLGKEQLLSRANASKYLALANHLAAELGPPIALAIGGVSGSGKSALATEIAQLLGCELLQTDAVRRELYGKSAEPAAYNENHYEPAKRHHVYDEMFRRAAPFIAEGVSVVLDGTFLSANQRQKSLEMAQQSGADFLFVRCECPDDVAIERLQQRHAKEPGLSEFRPELFQHQRSAIEPDSPTLPTLVVDSRRSLPELAKEVFEHLKIACRQRHPSPATTSQV